LRFGGAAAGRLPRRDKPCCIRRCKQRQGPFTATDVSHPGWTPPRFPGQGGCGSGAARLCGAEKRSGAGQRVCRRTHALREL